MILPNKLITFSDSILAKIVFILDELVVEDLKIDELYIRVKDKFDDINQYIVALDVLYTLEKINYNKKTQVVIYVKENTL
ncbi:MAG: hypothetical protein N4A40_08375 [Tissierellales bacterium]|jgi:hypothetical protein|nr:hypothetical protein [Tissierellales bacterium]